MVEDTLRQLIRRVREGGLSRRGFIRRVAGWGMTAPMATQLLAITGAAPAAGQGFPAFVGGLGGMIPRHIFQGFSGANARDAPGNLRPVGTGPYRFVSFTPGDTLRGELNPFYHLENRPHFDTLEINGGGDAVSAARAVLQTGDFHYAWNLLVEDDVLRRLETGGRGRVEVTPGGSVEFIQLNATDPNQEIEGERSSPRTTHPAFADPAVRRPSPF